VKGKDQNNWESIRVGGSADGVTEYKEQNTAMSRSGREKGGRSRGKQRQNGTDRKNGAVVRN